MNSTYRLFFAIEIPQSLQKSIADIVRQLKEQSTLSAVRWTHPEKWHLTICFLGEVQNEKMTSCFFCGEQALQKSMPFELTLGKLSLFPHGRPHLLVLRVLPSQELMALHDALKNALIMAGFKQEKRLFFPHITLGRFSRHISFNLDRIIIPSSQSQQVEDMVLLNSQIIPEGSVYTVIRRFNLNKI